MNIRRRQFLHLATGAAALTCRPGIASAQAYPTRPITLSVPYAAGGPLDVMVRVLAEGLRASLGQSIVIENIAGAGGSIGVVRAARAAPDGYTISSGNWSAPRERCHLRAADRSDEGPRSGIAHSVRGRSDHCA
jgi:tripartite-type tricarboxylate transporter receptor subunit TctC